MLVAPTPFNIEITCGITMQQIGFQLLDKNKVPLDYTGWTLEAQARVSVNDGVAIDFEPEWATEDSEGNPIDGAAIGSLIFPAKTPAETNAISPNTYSFDIVTISPTNERFGPYNQGKVIVEKNFSQI